MNPGRAAEDLIAALGISSPKEIDVEAIAFDSGVEVRYARLTGCEASLVGVGERAIATINRANVRGRERFSIAHEVGHWHLHRGRSFVCRADDPSVNLSSDRMLEREADTFAAHLLMPAVIFVPAIRSFRQPDLLQLGDVAEEFETSLMATAIRLAAVDTLPVVVACYGREGRKWSLRAPHVPSRWFLKNQLDEESFAYDLLHEGRECRRMSKQPAEVWFDDCDGDDYTVLEHCVPSRSGQVLVLIYLETQMMEVRSAWGVESRKDWDCAYASFRRRG